MPGVSVVIPSYNHERYIGECIQSVLAQTYQDFEIIITDDGSADGTVGVIKEFHDPRIQLHLHARNIGACTAVNNCIKRAAGKCVAVLSSDDAWEPTKLEKQVSYLAAHPEIGAVFTKAVFVDDSSKLLDLASYDRLYVFDRRNRSRYAWLNYFFYRGNCLCHPSILIRKECYDEVGLYDERMANLPDLDMWVRLCLRYEIHVLNEKLVRFRILADKSSASADKLSTHVRGRFEYMQILSHYFAVKDSDTFLRIFPRAVQYGTVERAHIPYFLARLALNVNNSAWQLWGLQTLFNLLQDEDMAMNLEKRYDFRYSDFYGLTASHDVFSISATMAPAGALSHHIPRPGAQNYGRLMNLAVRLHWVLANIALRIYDRLK